MVRRAKQIAALIVGWLFIVVGVMGLLVPIIPGWALIFAGALLLGFDAASYLHLLDRCERRFPSTRRWMDRLRAIVRREAKPSEKAHSESA